MLQYRVFVKDCLDLTGDPIANEVCLSFDIERDLLSQASSSFTLLNVPENIKEGDILGLVDPYGTVIYEGVIDSFDVEIQTKQILSIFEDDWRWHNPSPTKTTIEETIKALIESDFINSSDSLLATKFPFTVTVDSSTEGQIEQHKTIITENGKEKKVLDKKFVQSFEDFLIEQYKAYGVITEVFVPYRAGTPTITIKKATHPSLKVGNNALIVMNMTPTTEIFETNKLVIYDDDGTTLRKIYYGTTDGITDDPDDPLRLPVIKTKYVFDTDEKLTDLRDQSLQEEMLNHKIEFDLLLDNLLYDFFSWELGMPMEIWFNTRYFASDFTGYSISKTDTAEVSEVHIVCGTVRNKLTEILNGRL